MKRMTLKELFRQVEYCYNALSIAYDMAIHDPTDMEQLGSLITRYEYEFKKQKEEGEEWRKHRYAKK